MREKSFTSKQNKNSGFTLVEMIVVLVILGILASAAVYGISGYIDMTRFNNNEQNALSVFQSAQAAVNHKEEAGTSEDFALEIISIGTMDEYNSSNPGALDNVYNNSYFAVFPTDPESQSGQSVHMRYALTLTPGTEDDQGKIIKDLIADDFKSSDVLKSLITIEFDVEKVVDNAAKTRYSVNVYSVFYDSRRTSWDSVAKNSLTTIVPYREYSYRRSTSLVGYSNPQGTSSAVDTVFIPPDAEIKNTIVTLRNGETLDLSWSATSDTEPITGVPAHIHYTFSLYDADGDTANNKNKFCDLVIEEGSLVYEDSRKGIPQANLLDRSEGFYEKLKFSIDDFKNNTHNVGNNRTDNVIINGTNYTVLYTVESVSDKRGVPINIYRATIHTTAKAYVKLYTGNDKRDFDYNKEGSNVLTTNYLSDKYGYYTFPLAVSYEAHEGDGASDRITYTLSLDAIMSKNLYNNALSNTDISSTRILNYNISRLTNASRFIPTNTIPKNIYAVMVAAPNAFTSGVDESLNDNTGFVQSDVFYAERALDDPVYLTSEGNYRYYTNAAFRESGKKYAVVNAYFGDLKYGSLGSKDTATGGDAVITSCRHFSNLRLVLGFGKPVTYTIVRDLNWYTISTDGAGNEKYSSEVTVYSAVSGGSRLVGNSPVPIPDPIYDAGKYYGDLLSVVSFPAIPSINPNAVLIADDNTISNLSDSEDRTSVINNLQMRMSSFYAGDKTGLSDRNHGIICQNIGTIINLRVNGMTLTLDSVTDGSDDDRDKIREAVSEMIDGGTTSAEDNIVFDATSPIGGLVGANNGIMGSSTETDPFHNTIRFSNCIITSGRWKDGKWEILRASALGGIIGDNNGVQDNTYTKSVYGRMEATGTFVSGGWINVSSLIGYSNCDVDALLYVDNTMDTDKAILTLDNDVSSLIYGITDSVGCAVGSSNATRKFSQDVTPIPLTHTTDSEGKVTITEATDAVYAIDIKLCGNSYVLCEPDGTHKQEKTNREFGVGGAIGRLGGNRSGIFSARVINEGIIASYGNHNENFKSKSLGGAVGIMTGGYFTNAYISMNNSGMIGTVNGTTVSGQVHSTGGAVGRIIGVNASKGSFVISSINSGKVFGDCSFEYNITGTGGAVGTITGTRNSNIPNYFISAINNKNSRIYGITQTMADGTNGNNLFGTGGAAGFIEFTPPGSSIYSSIGENASVSSDGCNTGGCIGTLRSGIPYDPEGQYTSIASSLSNGSSVVSSGYNTGGCIGNASTVHYYSKIRSKITGSVNICGESNAGGVCGRAQLSSTVNSSVALLSGSDTSVINIKTSEGTAAEPVEGNNNCGGLIGYVTGAGSAFNLALSMPAQTAGNVLIINVDSYDCAGGLVGRFNLNQEINSEIRGVLNPYSHIRAVNTNAGGAIGYINGGGKLLHSDISITNASWLSDTSFPEITAGISNCGGAIGHAQNIKPEEGTTISVTSSAMAITSGINAGGVIGYSQENTLNGNILSSGGRLIVSGTVESTGGCIGLLQKGYVETTAVISYSCTDESWVTGADNVGGCVGTITDCSNVKGSFEFSLDTSVYGTGEAVGGIVGRVNNSTLKGGSGSACRMTYNGNNALIQGLGDYVGGIAGYFNGYINEYSQLSYSAENSNIHGQEHTGGIIGKMYNGSQNGYCTLIYSADSCSIKGTANTGGIIGNVDSAQINDYASNIYSAVSSSIEGSENTGGVFGKVNSKNSSSASHYTFNGEKCTILGSNNVGGIIGLSEDYENKSVILMAPFVSLDISGEDNIGGCIGLASGKPNRIDNPKITLDDCRLEIKGNGNTGGAAGMVQADCWYSGATVTAKNSSTLNISSTGSNAGGQVGYLTNMNMGTSSSMTITCEGNSTININGITSSGGFIGNSNITISSSINFTVNDSSSVNVTATGKDAGAGGLIGISNATVGRNSGSGTVNIPGGSGSLIVSSTSGYAGALIGVNNAPFCWTNSYIFAIRATIKESGTEVTVPKEMVIGLRNANDYNYKYIIDGTTYNWNDP